MSKYKLLWEYIKKENKDELKLSFDEIKDVLGFPIDHSFLNYKKKLVAYDYKVDKISLKEKYIIFKKEK
jgi:hypothetical protein